MERPPHSDSSTEKQLSSSIKNCSVILPVPENKNITAQKRNHIPEKGDFDSAVSSDYYEFKLCRQAKFKINKSLFTFRITQFIWHGGGSLPSTFLGVFLKQRGLTVVELSSVFSLIFLFQFISCFVNGIIADKTGNARPVLMFLIFSTSFVLFSMLLTPKINSISCILQEKYSNNSEQLEYRKFSSFCYFNCKFKNKKHFSHEENYSESSFIGNVSLVEFEISSNISESANPCEIFNISLPNIGSNSAHNTCCNFCVNRTEVVCVEARNKYLVIVYAVLILAFYSVFSTTYRFMNFTTASLSEINKSNIGKEIAVANISDLLVTIIIAFILNIDKSSGSEINFDPVIWVAAGIIFCSFLMSFATTATILPPGKNLLKKASDLLKDVDTLALILLAFISGNGYAFFLTFHLVFLETIDTPSIIIGLHSIAMIVYSIALCLSSKWWIDKLGTHKIFALGLFSHGVNFVTSSFMYNPWWCLVTDICVAFAFELHWISVLEHCWSVAPLGFAATYIALTGTVQFGIGRSSGVFFGGMLLNYLGPRKAYRIMAAIFFTAAGLYLILRYKRQKTIA